MFRSKDMELMRVILSMESAWDVINFIGQREAAMIVQQDSGDYDSSKSFINKSKMLEQWYQRLNSIVDKCERFGVKYMSHLDRHERIAKSLDQKLQVNRGQSKMQVDEYLMSIESKVKNLEDYFKNFDDFTSNMRQLDYTSAILRNLNSVIPPDMNPIDKGGSDIATLDDGSPDASKPARLADTKLMYYVGLIDTEQVSKFQKMVFRMTRGKVLVRSRDIGSIPNVFEHMGEKYKSLNPDDNQKGNSKSLLFMFFIGRDSVLGRKLKVITSIFDVYNVSLPGSSQEVNAMIVDTQKSRDEMSRVIRKSVDEIHTILEYFVYMQDSGVSRIDELYYLIQREKKICQVMSMLEPHNELHSIKLWIDKDKKNAFINDLNHFCEKSSNLVRPIINTIKVDLKKTKPPTKFDLNEFTEPFQNIVETYAIPKYKEINPAVFTCATFPFLFGVMFGDACHGLIMFIFGLYLLFKGKDWKARGGTYKVLASLRYLVAMLGFFSFYCGFIYNDFGSIPLITFESCYTMVNEHTKQEMFTRKEDCVYPVGVDWVWYMAKNEIPYQNSMKMKMSIIIGVLQMLFGIVLKGFNAIYFKSAVDFFFEFIPQLLFLGGLFGYMCVLIVIKWLTNWEGKEPPQIINVFTSLNKVEDKNVILGNKDVQQTVQTIILWTCLASALLMLFPKPIILTLREKDEALKHSKSATSPKRLTGNSDQPFEGTLDEHLLLDQEETEGNPLHAKKTEGGKEAKAHDGHEGGFGEHMVHQSIETIEFVLGSISNTASYLRLWALSLAHSQLASVFLSLLLAGNYIQIDGTPYLAAAFITVKFVALALATIGILLLMDPLECFLHTLRLHWVEFQSKFYKGEGLKYIAFNFRLEGSE